MDPPVARMFFVEQSVAVATGMHVRGEVQAEEFS